MFSDNSAADLTNCTAEILDVNPRHLRLRRELGHGPRHNHNPKSQPRDPPSKWNILHTNLSEKAHDIDGWRRLVEQVEPPMSHPLLPTRTRYAWLFVVAPPTLIDIYPKSSAQVAYINRFLHPERFHYPESLFQRLLVKSPCQLLICGSCSYHISGLLIHFSLAHVLIDFGNSRNHNDPGSRETVRKLTSER
jgi:hypothetical protein